MLASEQNKINKSLLEVQAQINLYQNKCEQLNYITHKETFEYCAGRLQYWKQLKQQLLNHE